MYRFDFRSLSQKLLLKSGHVAAAKAITDITAAFDVGAA